jgi:hypothetical protein
MIQELSVKYVKLKGPNITIINTQLMTCRKLIIIK